MLNNCIGTTSWHFPFVNNAKSSNMKNKNIQFPSLSKVPTEPQVATPTNTIIPGVSLNVVAKKKSEKTSRLSV